MTENNFIAPPQEWVSCYESEKLARLDSEAFLQDNVGNKAASNIIVSNVWGYYMCINAWICYTADLTTDTLGTKLRALIRRTGLISAIGICSSAADRLVAAINVSERLLPNDPVSFDIPDDGLPIEKEFLYRIRTLPHKVARQILVFPKRFAPVVPACSSRLHEMTVAKFLEVNKANVAIERRILSLMPLVVNDGARCLPFKTEDVRSEMVAIAKIARQLVRWLLGDFGGLSQQQYPRIGPGACRNAGRSKLERLEKIAAYGEYQPHTMGFVSQWISKRYLLVHPDLRDRFYKRLEDGKRRRIVRSPRCLKGYWGRSSVPQVCRVSSVPKSWKATRLIAIEDLCNMSHQLYVKDVMMERFENHPLGKILPLRQQERNRNLAREAARSDALATLDLSHASDSVTKALVRMLVPRSWWDYGYERCVPYGFILNEADERVQPLRMFATMGCGCTFPVESMVFMSLTLATILYYMGFSKDTVVRAIKQGQLDWLLDVVSFMGDDIIVPSLYAAAVIDTLEYFGFEVNGDKSFIRGRFRESCGADWARYDDGSVESLTCLYWPRIPIRGDATSADLRGQVTDFDPSTQERYVTSGYARLVALQHRLYEVSPSASDFLLAIIGYHFPDLQPSFPGESESLPWSNAASVRYGWYTDGGFRWDAVEGKLLQVGPKLASYEEAYAYYTDLFRKDDGAWYEKSDAAVHRRVVQALEFAKREFRLTPSLTVAHHWTGFNPGWAETFRYEESLRAVDARADDIIQVALAGLHCVNVQQSEHFVLRCVRPIRLDTAKLTAESYTLTSTNVEY